MISRSLWTTLAIWFCLSLVAPDRVECQGAGCPGPNQQGSNGWPRNKPVTYNIEALAAVAGSALDPNGNSQAASTIALAAAEAAFDQWTQRNGSNGSGVSFLRTTGTADFPVVLATSPIDSRDQNGNQIPGRPYTKGETTWPASSDGQVYKAEMKLDLNNVGNPQPGECGYEIQGVPRNVYVIQTEGPCVFFNKAERHFYDAVYKLVLHEIGHTMGLEDVAQKQPGASVMGGSYQKNDCLVVKPQIHPITGQSLIPTTNSCDSMSPTSPSQCDQSMVASVYASKPANAGPTPPGGGGDPPGDPPGGSDPPPQCADSDGDGYGNEFCGSGFVVDCDDGNPSMHPTASQLEACYLWLYATSSYEDSFDVNCDSEPENARVCFSMIGGAAIADPGFLQTGCYESADCGMSGQGHILLGEHYLYPGESRTSQNGSFTLIYQYDGNLVLSDSNGTTIWSSQTPGSPGMVRMRADAGLVIYNSVGDGVFDSGYRGSFDQFAPSFLRVEDNGTVVVYSPFDGPIWSTSSNGGGGGGQPPDPPPPPPPPQECQEYGLVWDPNGSVACSDQEQSCWETYMNPCTDAVWWIPDVYCTHWECAWW